MRPQRHLSEDPRFQVCRWERCCVREVGVDASVKISDFSRWLSKSHGYMVTLTHGSKNMVHISTHHMTFNTKIRFKGREPQQCPKISEYRNLMFHCGGGNCHSSLQYANAVYRFSLPCVVFGISRGTSTYLGMGVH